MQEPRYILPRIMFILLSLFGLLLLAGGIQLATLGGSLYYLLAGAALLVSGVLIARRQIAGVWVYGAFLIGTIIWAFWEVGFDYWPLFPRLNLPLFLGILVVLCVPKLRLDENRHREWTKASYATAIALGLILAGFLALAFVPSHIVTADDSKTMNSHRLTGTASDVLLQK